MDKIVDIVENTESENIIIIQNNKTNTKLKKSIKKKTLDYCYRCSRMQKIGDDISILQCKKINNTSKCKIRIKLYGNQNNIEDIYFYRSSNKHKFELINANSYFTPSTSIINCEISCMNIISQLYKENEDKYLLCGGHLESGAGDNIDTQFGITGKLKIQEYEINGIRREIKEELHYKILSDNIIGELPIVDEDPTNYYKYYLIDLDNIDDTQFFRITKENIKLINKKEKINKLNGTINDDRTCRIAVFIVGSKDTLEKYFNTFSSSELVSFDFIKILDLKLLFKTHVNYEIANT